MVPLTSDQVAAVLREYGQRLALQGGNPYRARAYLIASEQVASLGESLGLLVARGELMGIPGVGKAIADLVTRLYHTGADARLEAMRAELPAGLLELLSLPGVRPEQVRRIYEQTGIADLAALRTALESGALDGQKGFAPAFQKKLLHAIEMHRQHADALHISRAWALAEAARQRLSDAHPELREIIVAGDCRRNCELVGDIVLVAVADDEAAAKTFSTGGRVRVVACRPESVGAALLFATGSRAHLHLLQEIARKKKLTLGPDGLMRGKEVVAAESEAEIYAALDLPYVAPELREGRDELAIAAQGARLVALEDIKGVLHAHTTRSDGANSLEEMATAAQRAGYRYLGVTDHSQSAHYAGGLRPQEIEEQQREIARWNRSHASRLRVFRGIESDIRPDGALDYPDEILESFDLVIASVHGQFSMDRAAQTARLIRAIESPYTTILGHMTGRQLLRRPGYELEIEAVLQACAKNGVAVEINCNPWRLDLDWRWHQLALKVGCLMSIDPDAHATGEIELMRWGVGIARKGGVPAERVLTALDVGAFAEHLARRRAPQRRVRRAG